MMKLGFNTVLFGNHPIEVALDAAAKLEYDGVELSAIEGMSQHLDLELSTSENVNKLNELSRNYNIPYLAIERAKHDLKTWPKLIEIANGIECPIINIGPGGTFDKNNSFGSAIESISKHADLSEKHGVITCFKAHYNTCIDNTEQTLKALDLLDHPFLGLDFDPSHIFRVPENPIDALKSIFQRIKHVHFRDCIAQDIQGPGKPFEQICGRGKIDLKGLLAVLTEQNFNGPLNLEIIGTHDFSIEDCILIAAESKGWLNASLSL
jgi:sugar phosphate isomerase/epimerase